MQLPLPATLRFFRVGKCTETFRVIGLSLRASPRRILWLPKITWLQKITGLDWFLFALIVHFGLEFFLKSSALVLLYCYVFWLKIGFFSSFCYEIVLSTFDLYGNINKKTLDIELILLNKNACN